ncbi:glycosyltransferase family 2 protein [Pseudoalteromonas sp. SG44-1]|uniref:glycosyltransferase family 2 protein n=1 Tax=Pseudoalteromonas sp. SG44-1 TaxID=2760964 RepID=UPI001602BB49|nr:glycosyltransferase family 2 protein [Pseudoalteromonas sp. SG44-1]MBB1419449.1 glycosyltransferase family 2 protein [Pseudoalteromonas sp. SG44-1]
MNVNKLALLKTEDEIIANWKGNIESPVVSICCITYNHELYIEDALEGFLIQDTDFPFEILIHDDASTDKTAEIIKVYQEKYPRLIKPIYQTENQYSKKVHVSSTFNYPRVKGEYVAICEGDDFWTCKDKLQLQIAQLKANPDYKMSFHLAFRMDQQSKSKVEMGNYKHQFGIVSIEDIVEKKYGQIPAAATIFSSSILPVFTEFMENNTLTVGDIYLHFFSAYLGGGALFLQKNMSIYRVNISGSWNSVFGSDDDLKLQHLTSRAETYSLLNKYTKGKYNKSFNKSTYISCKCFLISKSDILLKSKVYNVMKKHVNITQKMKLFLLLKLNVLLPGVRWLLAIVRSRFYNMN